MNIAICVPSWPPGFAANGIVTYASYLVPALRELGHQVFVLTRHKITNDDDPFTIDLQRFVPSPNLRSRVFSRLSPDLVRYRVGADSLVRAIKYLIDKHRIDVLETEESFGWSAELSRLDLLPVVLRLHGPWFLNGQFSGHRRASKRSSFRERREGSAIERAQFVTAPAAQVLMAVKDHYGLKLPASGVIASPIEAAAPSRTWNIRECRPNTVLFVGRFDEHKGGDVALRAFSKLGEDDPSLRFIFVGPDEGVWMPNGNFVRYDEYVRMSFSSDVRARLEFLGTLSHFDIMALRTKYFLTAFASRYEVIGYTVLEAMSRGCPIVATAVGGVPELIENERTGMLVPSDNVTALAASCRRLLDDQNLAVQVGRAAYERCCADHSPKTLAVQTIDAYREACCAFAILRS